MKRIFYEGVLFYMHKKKTFEAYLFTYMNIYRIIASLRTYFNNLWLIASNKIAKIMRVRVTREKKKKIIMKKPTALQHK